MESMVRIDPDIQALIPEFMKNRVHDIELILQKTEQGNFEAVYEIGHRMKGAGTMYGFIDITDTGKRFEQAARSQDTELIKTACRELEIYLKTVKVVV